MTPDIDQVHLLLCKLGFHSDKKAYHDCWRPTRLRIFGPLRLSRYGRSAVSGITGGDELAICVAARPHPWFASAFLVTVPFKQVRPRHQALVVAGILDCRPFSS